MTFSRVFRAIFVLLFIVQPVIALIDGIYCGRENCYDVLLVEKYAVKGDIAKAYRQLAKKYHPDMHKSSEAKLKAEKKFREIANAYEILRDEDARKDYDYMLEHPQEMYMHYYKYYRRTMAPKVDVRIVICATISVISLFQYVSARQRFSTAISYCASNAKYRLQAISIAKTEGLISDTVKRKNKKSKEEQKEEDENIIRKIIEDKMDIQGGFARPSLRNVLWVQLVLLPITVSLWIWWHVQWIWKFTIMGKEYGKEEKLHLIRKHLGISELQFCTVNHDDLLHKELWKKEEFLAWKKIQDEEQRVKLAQNNKYKSYRRYMRNHGPGQISFED